MAIPVKTKIERIDRTIRRLPPLVYTSLCNLQIESWTSPEPLTFEQRLQGVHKTLVTGEVWGKLWDCAWIHFTGEVPPDGASQSVVLLIDIGGEGLVVDPNGQPLQGLTTIGSGFDFSLGRPGKRVVPVANPAAGGESIDVWVDAGLNDLFGSLPSGGKLVEASIAIRREDLQSLCFDFEVLRELLDHVPKSSARYASLLSALYEAALFVQGELTDSAISSAAARLASELIKSGGDPSLTISALGHAHIDLAWLWPIRETVRKGARTFSTVMRMMDRYPDYVFGASQPQLYDWMKTHYPSLYQEIKDRAKTGRWELQGAMWVEPDANIPSGESLARQLLYGKRFYRQEFGKDITNLWLPDVFGYSGSLPQILQKAGVDTFLTQKLSWSLFNQHPHHTFHWVGIDGSSVLVHMPPEATYNSSAAPRAIAKAENDYLDKEVSDSCLLLFGIGDGGGGPGEEHLERLSRQKNLSGLSPVIQETSDSFLQRLKKSSEKYAKWHGELYLERHQGTLTSQARNKRFNRKMEVLLRELELSATRSMLAGGTYPTEELDRIWKEFLLLQFHDILPGSSITRVYDESLERYQLLTDQLCSLLSEADQNAYGIGTEKLVSNSLSWDRHEWVKSGDIWYDIEIPGLACQPINGWGSKPTSPYASLTKLENEYLRLSLTESGDIISVFDKEMGREVLRSGEIANQLCLFEDQGDAWDFAVDYNEVPPIYPELVASEVLFDGPKAILRQTRKTQESTIIQEISLTSNRRIIEFSTKVNWRDRGKMLRTQFPVNVLLDTARCEIQFGNIERPTHSNTSWDLAKGEICAQRWIDISEETYGVALLNDCKYGHRVKDGTIDLNLLRSPSYPDPTADLAEHEFVYSLYPHPKGYIDARVVQEAYHLNMPLRLIDSGSSSSFGPLARLDVKNVIVEAIKKAEDSDSIVMRLYEANGTAIQAHVHFSIPISKVEVVNLIEDYDHDVDLVGSGVTVHFKPFEIITLRMVPG